jgi:hypothetical protein
LDWVRKLASYFGRLRCSCRGVEVGEVGAEETNQEGVEEVCQMLSAVGVEP